MLGIVIFSKQRCTRREFITFAILFPSYGVEDIGVDEARVA